MQTASDMRQTVIDVIHSVMRETDGNTVHLEREKVSITLFEIPLIGFADVDDPLFERYKEETVIGPDWMSPSEWFPEAQSVVSMFFPFTGEVRERERNECGGGTSEAWLYGRVEGQDFLNALLPTLRERLSSVGIRSCVPTLDERMALRPVLWEAGGDRDLHMVSAWSERHAAFACGLGTFGLSRGIITAKGMAGRLASILIDAYAKPDRRAYTEIYEYCIHCGACARRCPAGAITAECGKNNLICIARCDDLRERYAPRYGCGKCQTLVPCEHRNPRMKK